MEVLQDFLSDFNWHSIFKTILRLALIIIITGIVFKLTRRILKQIEKHLLRKSVKEGEPPSESQKRIDTIVRLLNQAFLLVIFIIALMVILGEIGIEIGPIIAGAGIVGLAVGFGAQNLVRDIISGFFIILENQIRVGDVGVINGTGGLVEKIKFRTIVLRDLSGTVHVFPNGTITTLSNLTKEWSAYVFEIGVAYKENTDDVIKVMEKVGEELFDSTEYKPLMFEIPEIFGVDKLDDSAVVIKGRIKTKPISQWKVGREYLRRIKLAFDQNNIEIPFPHRTVYYGDNNNPLAEMINKSKS